MGSQDQTVSPSSYLLSVHCSGWYSSCVCSLEGDKGVTNVASAAQKEGGEARIPLSAKGGVNGGCEGHNIDTGLTLIYGVRSRINIRLFIEYCIEGVINEA